MTDSEIVGYIAREQYSRALDGLYSILPAADKYVSTNNGTTADAADIFQDALVILCGKVRSGTFVLTSPLKNYLMAIVRNCWMQELRRRKQMPIGTFDDIEAGATTSETEKYRLAQEAFFSLGEKCRKLLIQFYFGGKSYSSIAAEMGFGDDLTAKNQKYRCLQKAKTNYLSLKKEQL